MFNVIQPRFSEPGHIILEEIGHVGSMIKDALISAVEYEREIGERINLLIREDEISIDSCSYELCKYMYSVVYHTLLYMKLLFTCERIGYGAWLTTDSVGGCIVPSPIKSPVMVRTHGAVWAILANIPGVRRQEGRESASN